MKIPTWPGFSSVLSRAIEYVEPPSPRAIPDPDSLRPVRPLEVVLLDDERRGLSSAGVVEADDVLGVAAAALVVPDVAALDLVELDEVRAVEPDARVWPEDVLVPVPLDADVGRVDSGDRLGDAGEVVGADRDVVALLEVDCLDVRSQILERVVLDHEVAAALEPDRLGGGSGQERYRPGVARVPGCSRSRSGGPTRRRAYRDNRDQHGDRERNDEEARVARLGWRGARGG